MFGDFAWNGIGIITRVSVLTWSEEFGAAPGSPPDPRTWTAEVGGGGWGSHQVQHYTEPPANAAVDANGCLAIIARRDAGGVTSARLITKDKLHLRYGRIEARIRVPAGIGMWPAFWMLGADIDRAEWPHCGEIDVMEYVGSQPTTVHGTVHGPDFAGLEQGIGHAHDAGVALAENFHVYGVEWGPDRVSWLLDGQTYFTLGPADTPHNAWPFQHDFFLVLNLAISGDWPGNRNDNPDLPATMKVDWIRAHDAAVRSTDGPPESPR